ncbi:MAG: transglutaminase domain-containing protein [Thermofilaceae archaeon]|nr:transglutaminase domain-containing protein [Thermofilaceae archaeon]
MGLFLLLATVIPSRYDSFAQTPVVVTNTVTYSLHGRFLLVNNNNFTVRDYVYVPLPQNSSFQKSFVNYMEPNPLRYLRDEDGNFYAIVVVEVEPKSNVWINVSYTVKVSAYRLGDAGALWPSLEIVRKYTSSSGYWNIYNSTLIDLSYRTALADTPLETARKLAEWVVARVGYRIELSRLGSDHALVARRFDYVIVGDCVEVADVYVTMARILGLPARTAYGLLLSGLKGRMWLNLTTLHEEGLQLLEHWGGHMWPQVYFTEVGWVDVDMLDGLKPNVGVYNENHILFGVEETKYYGSALSSACIPSYLTLQYVEYTYEGERT